jgi:hypothetical protein
MPGSTFNYDGAVVQTFTVASTGTYDITAYGGQGGHGGTASTATGGTGGLGAEIGGSFSPTKGEVLQIVVGGSGSGYGNGAGGGGGGSFVIETFNGTSAVDIPLVIAGGGGGGAFNNNKPGYQGGYGQTRGSGQPGSYGGGVGGSGGSGGAAGGHYGGGGGGYSGGLGAGSGTNPILATGGTGRGSGYAGGGSNYALGGFGGGGGGGYDGGGGGGGFSGGGGGGYAGRNLGYGGGGGGSFDSGTNQLLVAAENPGNGLVTIDLCYLRGTCILTPSGEVKVECLTIGDMVVSHSGEPQRITWIGTGKVLATRGRRSAATPVIVRKGALGDNVPNRDLRVTKGHSLYFDGVLIPVEFLVNHRSIFWDDRAQEVEIYHVELATHDVLLANGAPAESYRDDGNRWLFRNANSGWGQVAKPPCAEVLTGGPVVDAVWRRLLDRAGGRPGMTLRDDPDLHLVVDGRRLDAVSRHGEAYVFRLPAVAHSVRIVSRAAAPAELGVARDPRVLGVALRGITLLQGSRCRTIEMTDPALSEGFHAFEPGNGLRWTDGDAALPEAQFTAFEGAKEMVLHVGSTTQYPVWAEAVLPTAA